MRFGAGGDAGEPTAHELIDWQAGRIGELEEALELEAGRLREELEETRANLYQCKKERQILMDQLTAFTGNA